MSGVLEREDETIADDSADIEETSAQIAAMRRDEAKLRAATAAVAPITSVSQADLELPNVHFKGMLPLAGAATRAAVARYVRMN